MIAQDGRDAHGREGGRRAIVRTLETTPADATPLTAAVDCPGERTSHHGPADMGGLQRPAAPLGDLHALQRSSLRGQDIVGLYLSPPDRRWRSVVDEKSQIQALDRTQPVLPMLPDMPERRTATTSVTARPRCSPPSMSTGFVIVKCYRRGPGSSSISEGATGVSPGQHRHGQLRTAPVKAWLARRVHWIHFTPTSASWINQVERWFAELTRAAAARVHTSTGQRSRQPSSNNTTKRPFK